MKKMIKYPKTGQFRNIVKDVTHRARFARLDDDNKPIYKPNHEVEYPTITFTGTVKLHGSNGSVAYNDEAGYWSQARNRIVTIESDNAGFAFFVESLGKETLDRLFAGAKSQVDTSKNTIVIYSEWCGGNIQKGVAINGLPKMMVVFGVKVKPHDEELDSYWLKLEDCNISSDIHENIYNVHEFGTWSIDIDFSNPESSQNELVDMTRKVEEECPAGRYFGRKAGGEDNTTGEGIVWSAYINDNNGNNSIMRFKVKGDKHSTSRVKKLASVDPEKMKNIQDFVDYAVTENRLNQGIEEVFNVNNIEPDMKHTGDFIKWVKRDIASEEIDVIVSNGLEMRDVVPAISKKTVAWFKDFILEGI